MPSRSSTACISRLSEALLPAAGLVGLIIVWHALSILIGRGLPPPAAVWAAVSANLLESRYFVGLGLPAGGYATHIVSTTWTVLWGGAIGTAIGVSLAMAAARFRLLEDMLAPVVSVLGNIPILVAAPFCLIWFGVSDTAKVALVSFYSAVVVYVYSVRSIGHVAPRFCEYARTLGASRRRQLFEVLLPGAIPEIFGGVRAALGASWGLAAITELLGSRTGIGRMITATWAVQDLAAMAGGIILLGLVGLLTDCALLGLRRMLTPWVEERTVQ